MGQKSEKKETPTHGQQRRNYVRRKKQANKNDRKRNE
jgi:hypothetical protein